MLKSVYDFGFSVSLSMLWCLYIFSESLRMYVCYSTYYGKFHLKMTYRIKRVYVKGFEYIVGHGGNFLKVYFSVMCGIKQDKINMSFLRTGKLV